tara:strand:+ start:6227 stop:7600 length:1374 start_codon:yes stop_codon:yes gene_type:complete
MRIIINNLVSILETSNIKLKNILENKYKKKVDGYKFVSSYKKGFWDGSKKFFEKKTGKFGTGLLSYIIEDLRIAGLKYKIEDNRPDITLNNYSLSSLKYRDYQKLLIDKALKEKGCILKAPTGSGKTIVLAGLLKALENHTGLVIFNKKQLVYQTYEFLKSHGFDIGIAFGEGVDVKPITLCTIQSIDKVLDTHLKHSDFIIVDEVHEFSKGKLSLKAIKSFPNASYRIGMTATIPKDPVAKLNLISALGKIIEEVDATELIDLGFLTKPKIHILPAPNVALESSDSYLDVYRKCITENTLRNELIRSIIQTIQHKPSKTLILVKDLDHAKALQDIIPGSLKLEGKDGLSIRDATVKDFVSQEKGVLIATTIFQTGVDIPEITHLINARGLKSEIATLQALGRALRTHSSKQKVYIYDFMDKAPYLEKHSKERIKSYKSLNFKVDNHAEKKRKIQDK